MALRITAPDLQLVCPSVHELRLTKAYRMPSPDSAVTVTATIGIYTMIHAGDPSLLALCRYRWIGFHWQSLEYWGGMCYFVGVIGYNMASIVSIIYDCIYVNLTLYVRLPLQTFLAPLISSCAEACLS